MEFKVSVYVCKLKLVNSRTLVSDIQSLTLTLVF